MLAVGVKAYAVKPAKVDADELESALTFYGLAASIDPERDEVKPAIEKARRAGVSTVSIDVI